jgi:hypothetical protein
MGAALFVTGAFILLMLNMDLIYSLLDKDPTLTGRADFWPYIIDYIYQRRYSAGVYRVWGANPAAEEIFSWVFLASP